MANAGTDDFDIDLEADEKGPGSERRMTPRHPLKLGVRFSTPQELANAVRASTLNVGLGGLCLATKRAYEKGTQLMIKIELGAGEVIDVVGIVAWARPGKAVGVRFEHLTDDHRAKLANLIGKQVVHTAGAP
ncbi:MAG TPA: PilZ domain-containing protein [Myxococcales bacterium]|jgi:Tfp pilus assembly protein PilZ